MITATFYEYKGHTDTVNKVLNQGVPIKGILRDNINVLNPIFTIRSSSPITGNYCYIPVLNRYYFVDVVNVLSYDKTEIRLTVDVLKTYETEIMKAKATATQSDSANPFISTRNNVFIRKPNFDKINFPNSGLLSEENSNIIMVTIKGTK